MGAGDNQSKSYSAGVTLRRITREREWRGLSENALAKACGIDRRTLGRLRKGHTATLSAENIFKIAAALNASADYLLGLTDERRPKQAETTERLQWRLGGRWTLRTPSGHPIRLELQEGPGGERELAVLL